MKPVFTFDLPTKIEVGNGLFREAGPLITACISARHALLVTDAGIRRAGITDEVAASMKKAGFAVTLFDQVAPNPKDVDCEAGGNLAKEEAVDVIIAVGGGSVIDSAKAIALLQTHPGKLREYEGKGKVRQAVTPIVAIPTTAGTGSEVTRSAVITDTERKFKMTVKDVLLAPRLAVVDPSTTYTLPPALTATCGMDALVHAIEAYTCREANPLSDAAAIAAMGKIFPWLRTVVADGSSQEGRYELMVGSVLAGIAFSHADVAAVHCLAEALGGLYDTSHGVANSMFLPIVTAYNSHADLARHAKAAAACGLPVHGLSEKAAAALLVRELDKLAADIGIPKFSDYKQVSPADFPFLAAASERNGSTPSNCREIDQAGYLQLLEAAYNNAPIL